MKQFLEIITQCKISERSFRLGVLVLGVFLYIAWGGYCLTHGSPNQAMSYFLTPFMAGLLIFFRHSWLPVGIVRYFDELIERLVPPLLRDLTVIRSLIRAAISFLCLVFQTLHLFLRSILYFYRHRILEDTVRHQLLLVTNLSPRSPPAVL